MIYTIDIDADNMGMYPQATFAYPASSNKEGVLLSKPIYLENLASPIPFLLLHKSKITDNLEALLGFSNLLISSRLKEFIETFNIHSGYQCIPAVCKKRTKLHPYWILHFHSINLDDINFEKSKFYIGFVGGKVTERVHLKSKEEYLHLSQQLFPKNQFVCSSYLKEKEDPKYDIFSFLLLGPVSILCSERFKSAVESAGFTGITFRPLTAITRRLYWADTGLPVED